MQINCTYYSAVGDNDDWYLLARAIQLFTPGIPLVYYVGLLAGANDIELVENTKNGRDINRHGYSLEEAIAETDRPVVKVRLCLCLLVLVLVSPWWGMPVRAGSSLHHAHASRSWRRCTRHRSMCFKASCSLLRGTRKLTAGRDCVALLMLQHQSADQYTSVAHPADCQPARRSCSSCAASAMRTLRSTAPLSCWTRSKTSGIRSCCPPASLLVATATGPGRSTQQAWNRRYAYACSTSHARRVYMHFRFCRNR